MELGFSASITGQINLFLYDNLRKRFKIETFEMKI